MSTRFPGSALLFILASAPALVAAAAASGSLGGRVLDDQGRPVAKARIRIENRVSGFLQTAATDASGAYAVYNLPFSDYHLEVEAPGMEGVHRTVSVRSALPLKLDLTLKSASATVVVEDHVSLVEAHPSAHLDIDQSAIEKIPTAVSSRAMESVLLTTPGFIQDENGRFHFRGSHGQVTYVVDGVPVTDQMQATFSNAMDPSQVESMEVITGGVSAEYGGKPAAVVNITSKSGLGASRPFGGEVSLGASRFSTRELGFSARGGTAAFGYFVTGAASESDRFLDPVNFENLHNHGTTGRLSSRFDWLLGASDMLRFSASGGRTDRDVVNLASQQAAGQDQRQHDSDANLSLGWTHLLDANRSLDASIYYRGATSRLDPTR
ncbi:MAG TPA: TonB-dependent receptor, partial [Holophagaceae bacterium]